MIKHITSGVGVKSALRSGAKHAGKSILKRGTQHLMKGKGHTRKRKHDPSTALSLMLRSINSAKSTRKTYSFTSNLNRVIMSSTLKYIRCPVSELDLLELIGVQT